MSLAAGTVTSAGVGTGLALALYNSRVAQPWLVAVLASQPVSYTALALSSMADSCNADAAAIVGYITANASVVVTISTSAGGLQRSSSVGTATVAPTATQYLPGTIT